MNNVIVQKRLYGQKESGKCANCKKHTSKENTIRFLGKYLDGKQFVTEHFDVCKDCYWKIKQ